MEIRQICLVPGKGLSAQLLGTTSPWELPSLQIPAFGLRHGSYTRALTSSSSASQEATMHGWYSRQFEF